MHRLLALLVAVACSSSKQSEPPPVPMADPRQAAAAHDAKEWARCAELWLAVAATTKGEATAAPLYNAACCQAQAGNRDAAFATLDRAVAAGLDEPRIEEDIDLAPLHDDPRWAQLLQTIAARRAKAAASVGAPALREELLALAARDQAARRASLAADDPVEAEQALAALDADTTARMKQIVATHGWPGKSLVGKDGAYAAWLLVQHSRDVGFQKLCLEKLELAVAQGEAQAVEHAYLYDRVAVNTGKPQRWGTQFRDLAPFPIEDAARVDERRKAIGLPSLADYQEFLRTRGD